MKRAEVRFYLDADILGLAKTVAALRPDVTYPGATEQEIRGRLRPACVIQSTDTPDTIWIPKVASAGMVAITRDSHIERHPTELAAVMNNEARLFVLAPDKAATVWLQLELLMRQWRTIERLADEPGPYIYRVLRSLVRRTH